MKIGISLALLGMGLAAEAVSLKIDSCEPDAATGRVKTVYTLSGGPAIVTLGLQDSTGKPVPLAAAGGDVNREFAAGSHTAYWTPGVDTGWADSGLTVALKAWPKSNPPDWMVVDPSTGEKTYYADKSQLPGTVNGAAYKGVLLAFRRIHAKGQSYYMGADPSDAGRLSNETRHLVTLANDFYMGIYPVTQGQYKSLTGTNPSYATERQNGNVYTNGFWRAVERVSYADLRGDAGANWPTDGHSVTASSFIGLLRARTGDDAFDLPTEAEWEYACRAGTTSAFNNGTGYTYDNMLAIAWVTPNSLTGDSAAALVGLKAPNAWDLYDMHGTVYEYCLDWYSEDLGTAAVTAPTGPTTGANRVVRGGGMAYQNDSVGYKLTRSAGRRPDVKWNNSNIAALLIGFRLAYEIPAAEGDDPAEDFASADAVTPLVAARAEPTAHGTVENPFEAWDRAVMPMSIELFNSFPPRGVLLMLR